MDIQSIVQKHLYTSKIVKRRVRLITINNGIVRLRFLLKVPAWINDTEFIKDENHSIIYFSKNKKETITVNHVDFDNNTTSRSVYSFTVDITNLNSPYPKGISGNKFLCIYREYKLMDLFNPDMDLDHFLDNEWNNVFMEIRSNITLMKIGELTKKWDALTSGKRFYSELRSYGKSKIKY